jgi:hypothetical protein
VVAVSAGQESDVKIRRRRQTLGIDPFGQVKEGEAFTHQSTNQQTVFNQAQTPNEDCQSNRILLNWLRLDFQTPRSHVQTTKRPTKLVKGNLLPIGSSERRSQ